MKRNTSNSPFKIWSNNAFTPAQKKERAWLENALADQNFILFEPAENGRDGVSAEFLAEADIAFGAPDPAAVLKCENLAWVHLNTAGYAAYDHEEFKDTYKKRGGTLTNSSSVYNEPCAQHLLAMILSLSRRLPVAWRHQANDRAWNYHGLRSKIILLDERQTMLVFGYGTIAKRLVELLAPLKIKITGVRRQKKGDEPVDTITEQEVDEYLPQADHVVNILPENEGTRNYFDAEKIALIKPGALFYNIGRGTTVDQKVLIKALNQQKISAAYLDVTDPEPLPPDHPLWTTPNCYITPHIAGGFNGEKQLQIEHFIANLNRYRNDDELLDVIIS